MKVVATLLMMLLPFAANAQAFKCKEAGTGKTIYSDMPCPANSSGGYRADFPSVNVGEGRHYQGRSSTFENGAPRGGAIERSEVAAPVQQDVKRPRRSGRDMPAPRQPSAITSCDAGGCWDNVGGRYTKGAGQTYFPSSGGACQMIGGRMQCP